MYSEPIDAFEDDQRSKDVNFIRFLESSQSTQDGEFLTSDAKCGQFVIVRQGENQICVYNLPIYQLCHERNLPAPYDARVLHKEQKRRGSTCSDTSNSRRASICSQRRGSTCSDTSISRIASISSQRMGSTCSDTSMYYIS